MKYSPIISILGPLKDNPLDCFLEEDRATAEVAIDLIGNAHLRLKSENRTRHFTLSPPYVITWKEKP